MKTNTYKSFAFKVLALSVLGLALSNVSANTSDFGGQDSGGGNIQPGSSFMEVARAIRTSHHQLPELMKNAVTIPNAVSAWNADDLIIVNQIKKRLERPTNQIDVETMFDYMGEGQAKNPWFRCKGPNGEEVDASTTMGNLGSRICIDPLRLKRIPAYSLVPEVSALLLHELSHQFGCNEEQAQRIQKTFLGVYLLIQQKAGDGLVIERLKKDIAVLKDLASQDIARQEAIGNFETHVMNPGTKEYHERCALMSSLMQVVQQAIQDMESFRYISTATIREFGPEGNIYQPDPYEMIQAAKSLKEPTESCQRFESVNIDEGMRYATDRGILRKVQALQADFAKAGFGSL